MATKTCDRCGKPAYILEGCEFCKRKLCKECIKSSKRIKKLRRMVICRDCWGKMDLRTKFKQA